MQTFADPKDPDDVDVFTFDWRDVLDSGETISTFSAVAVTAGITVDSTAISGTETRARLSGGTANSTYEVRYRITTSAGRQLDETARIKVKVR